ncbi:hypothetical protein [Planktotalea sp.]|uniref:hypothetical protein n=1 Tax=Planktotalea sp. TaxID=2029877 RepID=UPI003D6AF3A4
MRTYRSGAEVKGALKPLGASHRHASRRVFKCLASVLLLPTLAIGAFADTSSNISKTFSGAGLHAVSGQVAIAYSDGANGSGISLRSLETLSELQDVKTPEGVRAYDPSFNTDGSSLVYAGFCPSIGAPCSGDAPGWNIFELALNTGTSTRLSEPDTNLMRVTPRYDDVTGDVFYVGVSATISSDIDRLVSPSAVFKITDQRASEAVFPSGSYSAENGAIFDPIGTLNAVDLLSVSDGKLSVKARIKVPSSRPILLGSNAAKADERLIKAADRVFYSKPRRDFRDRETANTLIFVEGDRLVFADEYPQVSAVLSARLGLHVAAADPQSNSAFVIVQSLDPNVRNALASITPTDTQILYQLPDLTSVPLDFEVSGSSAALFVQEADASVSAFVFSDWGAPRLVSVFKMGEH